MKVELLKVFLTGLFIGGIFTLLKLPIPAPQVFGGVVAIIGIFTGFYLIKLFL